MAENKKKVNPISFRVTDDQSNEIEYRAAKCSLNVSQYILKTIFENDLTVIDKSDVICRHLCKISTEVNKLKREHPKLDTTNINKECEYLWHALKSKMDLI